MSLTKKQKERVMRHIGEMGAIAVVIAILWALTSIARSQGF